jgi:hypothetical protein
MHQNHAGYWDMATIKAKVRNGAPKMISSAQSLSARTMKTG